jgi:hypothetical protein
VYDAAAVGRGASNIRFGLASVPRPPERDIFEDLIGTEASGFV